MKKNIISKLAVIALAGIMAAGFAGCDSTNVSSDDTSNVGGESSAAENNDNNNVNDNANPVPDANNDADPAPEQPKETVETFKDYSNKTVENGQSAKWFWIDNGVEDLLGDGEIFEITFKIKDGSADGNYNVAINDFAMCNKDLAIINAKVSDGVVTIGSAEAPAQETPGETSVFLSNVSGNAGDTIKMKVCMVKNPGFCTVQLGVNYDSSVLEIVDVTSVGILSEIGTVQKNLG